MGNVIPWSQIDPSIKSEQPFVGVIMVDPKGKLCVSELVHLDPETVENVDHVAGEIVALAQQAAARVAASYRSSRSPRRVAKLRLLNGGQP